MSRIWIVVAVLVVAALGVGAAFALGLFDGGGQEVPEAAEQPAASTTTLGATTTLERTPPMTAVTTLPGEDPLCLAHAEMVAALDGHLPVEGAEDLEIVRTATLAFYTEAVGHVVPPESDAFSEYLGYEQEVYDWSGANEWSPDRSLEDLTENPPPTVPAEALAMVRRGRRPGVTDHGAMVPGFHPAGENLARTPCNGRGTRSMSRASTSSSA